ncbi:hypothetical protein [Conexibacter sp. CPCC 206217]|uniref:hypothetical protein n=1 Tax=Conexibacter sp. CPCC 206217 TaxID=3064574 RepID=UPI0027270E63|nr:hypothetical protein [Conexibacter sp. CPCC 206217]MDO8211379.1 hypothetical protein [Conexibacter sp. CPCC 206217]
MPDDGVTSGMQRSSLLRAGTNEQALDRARVGMARNATLFAAFEAEAMRMHAAGDELASAAWAQIAFHIGWAFPSGTFMSPRLERLLLELGRRHVPGGETQAASAAPASVLHVMTEAYPSGGHTRMVERWIERDQRTATIALTAQTAEVPTVLTETAAANDVPIVSLEQDGDLFARARRLRQLACAHDLVVLHTHMHDVVPALALADPVGRPATVMFEHASHMISAGIGVSDVVACMRPIDARVSRSRRGLDSERVCVLPLLEGRRHLPPRALARAELGLPADAPVFLTIAAAWKIHAVIAPTFGDISSAVMDAVPGAYHLVAGPQMSPQWRRVIEDHGDRVRVLGGVLEIEPLLSAADVYLDAWPVSGSTTILDVAAAQLPIIAFGDGSAGLAMVKALEPLGSGAIEASTTAAVGQLAAALMADPARRRAMGQAVTDARQRDHGRGWNRHLEAVVERAVELRGTARVPEAIHDTLVADWESVIHLQLGDSAGYTAQSLMWLHARLLPAPLQPPNAVAAAVQVERLVAEHAARPRRRAVAAPALTSTAVRQTLAQLRGLLAAGEIDACIVALPPDRLDEGLELLQAAIDTDGDLAIDLDVLPASLSDVARCEDLVLT